jgi:uncharacterized protein
MNTFEIRPTKTKGQGLYALHHFEANQVILKFAGKVLTKAEVYALPNTDSYLQISPDLYLDLTGDLSHFVNHSCNPNTYVKIISRTAALISTRAIKPNEELSFDYSMTSTETPEDWQMKCGCGSWNCRKNISGFSSLSDKEQEQLIKANVVPMYVIK